MALIRAREKLANRGPDGAGVWAQGPVGLAHRRLAILDLSERGAQPMPSADGSLVVSFNGEIYNFKELRAQLAAAGYDFRTQTDTEVILAAYREWGRDCVKHFNGMFAFALWDAHRRVLCLARDRLGVKPLYYSLDRRRLVFGSTATAVTAFADVSRETSSDAIHLYFQMAYIPAPFSIYRDVRKLEPGIWAEFTADGGVRDYRYWSLGPRGTNSRVSRQEAVDELESLLESSVQYRLISDVPVGAFLSGGVDSSAVVAMMCRNADTVRTFTVGFAEADFDESAHARKVARLLGTRHEEITLGPHDLLRIAASVPDHYDEPYADASAIPSLALAELARTQVTVALSGDGGDELFSGYPYYDLLARLDPWRGRTGIVAPLFRATSALPLPHRTSMGLVALGTRRTSEMYAYMRGPLKTRPYARIFAHTAAEAANWFDGRINSEIPPGGLVETYMDLDLRSYLVDDILVKVDRATMAHGLEARDPLLDYRFVEYTRALPGHFHTAAPGGKALLRQLLARHLPAALFDRPKQGFSVPLRAWFRGPLVPALREVVHNGWLKSSGLVRRGSLEAIAQEHISGRRNHENFLWSVFSFEQWYRHHR
jgi:asparagine synthase (glutamine-hydrolysing)